MHVKGLELSAYDPRGSFAQGVEYATTNRGGCHVQGASMYMESVGPLTINPQNLKLKADIPIVQQNIACAINSMVLCIFTTYGMIPKAVHEMNPNSFTHRALAFAFENMPGRCCAAAMGMKGKPMLWFEKWLTYITGTTFSSGHLQEIGARIFNLERMYNLREGLTGADDTLPPRILHESTFPDMDSGHPLHLLLPRYYKKRGWSADGVPLRRTLEQAPGAGLGGGDVRSTVQLTYEMARSSARSASRSRARRRSPTSLRMTRERFAARPRASTSSRASRRWRSTACW